MAETIPAEYKGIILANIVERGPGRYKVPSREDPDTDYLVKYWADQHGWTCDCPWGVMKAESTGQLCAHAEACILKYGREQVKQ